MLLSPQTAKKLRGCFVYTSSAAACIVSPFTVLYAATKAFLSAFGAGLAAEVRHKGIDVLVFHPSPVATRFYDKVRWCQQALRWYLLFQDASRRGCCCT